jgi:VWFA-related protein
MPVEEYIMNALSGTGAVLLSLISISSSAFAQQAFVSSPPANVAASTDSNAIKFDVVVTDKSGKPVAGLQQSDFTILDNKHPAVIAGFQPHSSARISSDQIDASTETVIILDEANAPFDRAVYARQSIETYLKQNGGQLMHPVSLGFLTDRGLELQTAPSIDGNALADAIQQRPQGHRAIESGALFGGSERLQLSQTALDQLIHQEQPKPGRKMVIWVSPGWPLLSEPTVQLSARQEQAVLDNVVRLSAALRQARITLYSVDSLATAGERTAFYQNFTDPLTKSGNAHFGDLGLQVLVTQTGGRVIFGTEPIQNSINRCVADLDAFYTVSVEPAPADRPYQFHQLEVKLITPSLKARTRNGYYAQP